MANAIEPDAMTQRVQGRSNFIAQGYFGLRHFLLHRARVIEPPRLSERVMNSEFATTLATDVPVTGLLHRARCRPVLNLCLRRPTVTLAVSIERNVVLIHFYVGIAHS